MTLPLGFRYASTYARIRKVRKDDLALIVADQPASVAAVFTRNQIKAAPVLLAQQHLKSSKGRVRAILINAGNANCATRTGAAVANESCRAAAKALAVEASAILPSSTGVIGVELDPALITKALPGLVAALSPDKFHDVAEAIMTTDLVPKVSFAEVATARGTVRIAGMTKGSGMIQPNMATTLGFLMTDAAISPAVLRRVAVSAADASYNRLSVDGDTSTNDMLAVLASGASGIAIGRDDLWTFTEAITKVSQHLAEQIARDGEGAGKLVTINVTGAKDDAAATQLARAIANSPLVKTAIAGSDPNWGRILSAAGNSGVVFDAAKTDIYLQGTLVCEGGLAAPFSERDVKRKLAAKDCQIDFVIRGKGAGQSRFWTCDFTEGYIRINASYRT
ncbi:MAG: bifunctional glutamate N-acetyltransferase/amino-acid acetyltransferase ArgJ [Bryobacteraceae bacterium]